MTIGITTRGNIHLKNKFLVREIPRCCALQRRWRWQKILASCHLELKMTRWRWQKILVSHFVEVEMTRWRCQNFLASHFVEVEMTRWRCQKIQASHFVEVKMTRWRCQKILVSHLVEVKMTRWRWQKIVSSHLVGVKMTRWRWQNLAYGDTTSRLVVWLIVRNNLLRPGAFSKVGNLRKSLCTFSYHHLKLATRPVGWSCGLLSAIICCVLARFLRLAI